MRGPHSPWPVLCSESIARQFRNVCGPQNERVSPGARSPGSTHHGPICRRRRYGEHHGWLLSIGWYQPGACNDFRLHRRPSCRRLTQKPNPIMKCQKVPPHPALALLATGESAGRIRCQRLNTMSGTEARITCDLPPEDVPIKSGSPGSRLLDRFLG
ncbi:hypothetical protein FQZ97_777980 [compost metagenome]